MREQEAMVYGGDILEEMEECGKLAVDEEQFVVYGSQSLTCHAFLTILCC